MLIKNLNNESFAILGAGRSGIGIAKLLKKRGAKVFLSESSSLDKLKYFDEKILNELNIPFELGGHSNEIYNYDKIIKSPGITLNSEVLIKAKKLNKKIYSEIEIAYRLCPCPVIAVTGTNGKTTTTFLIGEIFKNAGYDTKVCGNVGLAFSEIVDELNENSIVVLEVSSFQLESTELFKPAVSLFLNFTPDHLDWHGNLENYMNAKLKINTNQTEENTFVFNYDDKNILAQINIFKGISCPFSVKFNLEKEDIMQGCYSVNENVIYFNSNENETSVIIRKSDIFIKGKHNLCNSLAAISAAKAFNINNNIIKYTLMNFKGVEHRIELSGEINGVKYYNDSKATNFDSMYVALESFEKNIILIMGGKKGDNNFELVKKFITEKVKNIIAIGQSAPAITEYFSLSKNVRNAESLDKAVNIANEIAVKGDVVLFSPGYKSFDMFDNFEHRGEVFKNAVKKLNNFK